MAASTLPSFTSLRRQAVQDGVVGLVGGDPDAQSAGLISHGAVGDHLLHDLRHVNGEQLGRQLTASRHVLDPFRHLLRGQIFLADGSHHGCVGVAVRWSCPEVGDQIGDHGKADQAQKHGQSDAHSLVAAAK